MGLVGEDFSDFLGCGMSNRGVATFWARMSIRVIEVLQHLAADHLPGTLLEEYSWRGQAPPLLYTNERHQASYSRGGACPRHGSYHVSSRGPS